MSKFVKEIVGYGEWAGRVRRVYSGETIFRAIDQEGLPLPVVLHLLQAEDAAFDLRGFVLCALRSGNFSVRRLRRLLLDAASDTGQLTPELTRDVDLILSAGGEA